jgi:hypothetical protein
MKDSKRLFLANLMKPTFYSYRIIQVGVSRQRYGMKMVQREEE